jgi:hypothetical protein
MKAFSMIDTGGLIVGSQVRGEVIASENGRSLIMLDGRPVHVDGEYPAGHSLAGRLAATDGGFRIIAADSSAGVSAEKLLQNAGIHENGQDLLKNLRSYGVPITRDNLAYAGELLTRLPGGAADKNNLAVVALMLARRLNPATAPLLGEYLAGNLRFSGLFAGLPKSLQQMMQQYWGEGRLIEALQNLVAGTGDDFAAFGRFAGKMEEFARNLHLQEMISVPSANADEGRIYFQWPMFWHNQDIPDTLEGEAFIPAGGDRQNGFSLRLLINPPSLGQIEVALHQMQKSLWVHFGVEEKSLDAVRSLFPVLRERLVNENFNQVRLTAGKARILRNFFCCDSTEVSPRPEAAKIDLKV